MSKRFILPPCVRRKSAKGRVYHYWARSEPWTRLPDPYTDPDGFMRKLAQLQRMGALEDDRQRTGTFGGLVADYRRSKHFREKLSANTRKIYDHYMTRLLVAYKDAPLRELTPEDIQRRVLDANEDTPGAANMMLAILGALYAFARKRHRGLADWTEGLERFESETEREPWPDDMLKASLASDDVLFRGAVALALYTGQRPGNVCAMTWGMVAGDTIRVKQQKTKTSLEIPIHEDLQPVLNALPRSDRHLFLLSNHRGDRLTGDVFRNWCKEFGGRWHINRTPHGLRKNATNKLFELGCSAAEVASITWHKSIQMLENYAKGRSQSKIARVAMAKWQTKPNKNGKTNA